MNEAFESADWSPATGLLDAIPGRLMKQTQNYHVEYGVRIDDNAMIFHFYPPDTDWTYYPPTTPGSWAAAYAMNDRLERAMPKVFDVKFLKASFTELNQSFCIIAKGVGASPDPFYFAHRFFEEIDAPL